MSSSILPILVLCLLAAPLLAGLLYSALASQRAAAALIERDTQDGTYAVREAAADRQASKGNLRAAAAWRP